MRVRGYRSVRATGRASPLRARQTLGRGRSCAVASLEGLPAQARRGADAGAVSARAPRARKAADLRRPAPRRPPAPLRLPARARRGARELGGAEGRAARARARSTSPSTSRTTRSTYATFEGEIPAGQLRRGHGRDLGPRHLRARRGEAERRPDRSPARRAARGHVGARAGEARRRPEELAARRRRRRSAPAPRSGARVRPMLATLARGRARPATGWLFEVKWDGYRAIAHDPRRRRRR